MITKINSNKVLLKLHHEFRILVGDYQSRLYLGSNRVCVCVCRSVWLCVVVCVYVCVCLCARVVVCVYVLTYAYVCVRVCVCTRRSACKYRYQTTR